MSDIETLGRCKPSPSPSRLKRAALEFFVIVHRWIGLSAMAWLIVLGLTGILIDHPDWRWVRQWTIDGSFASPKAVRDSNGAVIRKFQINSGDERQIIGGSARGMWRTADGGTTWDAVPFNHSGTPIIFGIVPLSDDGWSRLLLATDDGLWVVNGGEGSAIPFALEGLLISAVASTPDRRFVIGVHDRWRIFKIAANSPEEVAWTEPSVNPATGFPDQVGLTRFAFDVHFAQGLATDRLSLLFNDFGGMAVIILSLTGFFFWLLARRKQQADSARNLPIKRATALRWLYRCHGPILGMLAVVPIVMLSLTGIFVGHATALSPWAQTVQISRTFIPGGAHSLATLKGQIDSLAVRSSDSAWLSAMTRLGLIESRDGGASWTFERAGPISAEQENLNPGHVGRTGLETIGKRGTVTYARDSGDGSWRKIEGLRSMVMDAVPHGDGWVLKTSGGFFAWRSGGSAVRLDIPSPVTGGISLDRFLTDLHGGLMIHPEFAWLNDIFALAAIFLSITGLISWWKRKWI